MFPSTILLLALAYFAVPIDCAAAGSDPNVALFNLTGVKPPSSAVLKAVFVGYGILSTDDFLTEGTQNYTCNATTKQYSDNPLAGAKLLDVTFSFTGTSPPQTLPAIQTLQVVGTFFWVPNPSTTGPALVERWETNDGLFFVGTKNSTEESEIPSFSIVHVFLNHIEGTLADFVVRANTVGGVVPDALMDCSVGDTIAIPYSANYLFFNNSGTATSASTGGLVTSTSTSAPSIATFNPGSGVDSLRVDLTGVVTMILAASLFPLIFGF